MTYKETAENLGDIVKSNFPNYPWRYSKVGIHWRIFGDKVVAKFCKENDVSSIIEKLGSRFEGYGIIVDVQDSYLWIGLD
jgi:hypothetical protein